MNKHQLSLKEQVRVLELQNAKLREDYLDITKIIEDQESEIERIKIIIAHEDTE